MNLNRVPQYPAHEDARTLSFPLDSAELTLGYEAAYPFLADVLVNSVDEGESLLSYRPA